MTRLTLRPTASIVGVIDWEFSYAAPNEFTFAPPWRLLLEQPEYWTEGLDNWIERYESCLPIFLEAMEDCEDAAIASGKIQDDQRLSYKMVFDPDEMSTGSLEDTWKNRLGLLDDQTRAAMDSFVVKKMAQTETRELAWDPDEYTLKYQALVTD
ncbi:hypothetical protein ED733_002516 [Metarhizium rileyi]|uniref:Aminoglycoside phosphotransferase domain-containing protein n=1 Tax=Metarhizium rileyi (strain RCEF 4871) TaxID=1649241 RepID=A0A5C6G498_METRR|nr:hypothetical protein ED733_002516 [Metarhizium rileyi]